MKATVNGRKTFEVEFEDPAKGKLNGKGFAWDLVSTGAGSFHVIRDGKSFSADVISAEPAEKKFVIAVSGNKYTVFVKDKYDELLHALGMDGGGALRVAEVRAPMPGLVLDVKVSEGDDVKKGDALLVLEAMKMENIIRSPADGKVKKVNAKKSLAVEKNQVLITFS